MKKYIFLALALLTAVSAMAQPKKSRVAQNNNSAAAQKKTAQKVDRSSIMYPTAVAVPEEVTWRRDIYRELDLRLDENAPLYYPDMPKDGEQNLFFTLFRLLNVGRIPAYNYKTDGTEHFDRANRMHFRDMLDRYEIPYEVDSARRAINVADADVPGSGDHGRPALDLHRGEYSVSVDGNDCGIGCYPSKSRLDSSSSSADIMAVHGVGDGPVGIRVEIPVNEFVSLVTLVRGRPAGEQAIGVRLALPDLEALEATVGDQGLSSRATQSVRSS